MKFFFTIRNIDSSFFTTTTRLTNNLVLAVSCASSKMESSIKQTEMHIKGTTKHSKTFLTDTLLHGIF